MTGGRAARSRVTWGLADQGVSALSNVLLTVMVARTSTPGELGEFSFVYVLFVLVLGLTRTSGGAVLAIEHGDDADGLRAAASRSTGYAVGVGAAVGLLGLAAAAVVGGAVRPVVVLVALGLPLLLLQDAWRSLFFCQGRPRAAFLNDLVWLTAQVLLLVLVFRAQASPGIASLVACWVSAGALAAAVGLLQSGVVPAPAPPGRWLRSHAAVGGPLVASELLTQLPAHLVYLLVPVVASTADLGVVRACYVFFGPLAVLNAGAAMLALPTAVSARAAGGVDALGRKVSLVLAATSCAWGALVVALPGSVGTALVGASWEGSQPTRALLAVSLVAEALLVGQCAALAALRQTRRLARLRTASAPITVLAGLGLAAAFGAAGVAGGFAVGYWVAAGLSWAALRAAGGRVLSPHAAGAKVTSS